MTLSITSDDDWQAVLARFAEPGAMDDSARAHGALTRRREVRDGATLLRLGLGYGPCGLSLREVSAWAEAQGIATLSDVALLKRLRGAADWFSALVAQLLADQAAVALDGLGERPLRLVDGTAIRAPGSRGADWRLHAVYDPRSHRMAALELTDGRGAERLERFPVVRDEIRIGDCGFGSRPDGIRALTESAGDYVVRVNWRGLHWQDSAGGRFDVLSFLRTMGAEGIAEAAVLVGRAHGKRAWTPVPARLIAVRLPPQQAEAARKRARKASRKNRRRIMSDTVEAAGYVLMLTSLDGHDYPPAHVAALYRLRWQIELAFKRLKSLLHFDELRAKDPDLARAWLNTHLIAALLIDDMVQQTLDAPP
jgi:IS4 transposase